MGSLVELTQIGPYEWENNYPGTSDLSFVDAHQINLKYQDENQTRPGFWKLVATSDKYDGTGWYKEKIFDANTSSFIDAPYGDPASPFGSYTGDLQSIIVDGRGGGYTVDSSQTRDPSLFYTRTEVLPGYSSSQTLFNADKETGRPIYNIDIDANGTSKYCINYGLSINEIDEIFDVSNTCFKEGVNELLNITPAQQAEYKYLSGRLSEYNFDLGTQTFDEEAIKDLFYLNYDTDLDGWYPEAEQTGVLGPFMAIKISGQLEAYQNNPALSDVFQNEDFTDVYLPARLVIDSNQNSTINEINSRVLNLLIPEMSNDGTWNGNVKGFYLMEFGFYKQIKEATYGFTSPYADRMIGNMLKRDIQYLITNKGFKLYSLEQTDLDPVEEFLQQPSKYNYSNVLCEIRNGDQNQTSLSYFKDVTVDFQYDSRLWGPFKTTGQVQRIVQGQNMLTPVNKFNLGYQNEGSNDNRSDRDDDNRSFSDWNDKAANFNERALPFTHIIYNNNVNAVFFTLQINQLKDTVQQDIGDPQKPDFRAGTLIPATMVFKVEVGYVDDEGIFSNTLEVVYRLSSLVQQPALLDVGNPDLRSAIDDMDYLEEISRSDSSGFNLCNPTNFTLFDPFPLPPAYQPNDPNDTSRSEDVKRKRFLRVTKLSAETNSILIQKEMMMRKVTEIMPLRMRYPFSAIAGLKVDSRIFEKPPIRAFDCKLKIVKVPTNYFPTNQNDLDLRYWDKEEDLLPLTEEQKRIYKGDWDGSFKYEWTDNPAWILYDIITSSRYGLGEHVREGQVNKWDLYKIARFCDAVDEAGVYQGVSDGRGGLEPRFACNIMFSQGTRVFDALNTIASVFRGFIYYQNSEISFSDDRTKEPIAIFTNSMVENGEFQYSNLKRDEKFNSIEVSYIDKFDGFKTKVEYVEDESDVSKRGTYKKTVNGFGITSKAQANRLAKHILFQGTQEDQGIAFTVGLESLLVAPGDLIVIEDDLKSLDSNFGRVLDINTTSGTIRTSQPFINGDYEDYVTLYVPTAKQTIQEIESLNELVRSRLYGFTIESSSSITFNNSFEGDYTFEKYLDGYEDVYDQFGSYIDPLQNQYALYKGGPSNNSYLYFSTGVTGWVFSTGYYSADNNTYDKYIVRGTDVFDFIDITSPNPGSESSADILLYDTNQTDRRGALSFNGSGLISYQGTQTFDYSTGVTESDIELTSAQQIIDFPVTGTNSKEFGDLIYLDQNDPTTALLPFVPKGTSYRFKSKNKEDQIFKVVSIKEDSDNKYVIEGIKYVKDRYDKIEAPGLIEDPMDDYGYFENQFNVINVNYIKLEEPIITLQQGYSQGVYDNYITADWQDIIGATGYNVEFVIPNGQRIKKLGLTTSSCILDDIYSIGKYKIRVQAKGLTFDNNNLNTRYYDSDIGEQNIQILNLQNLPNQGDPDLIPEMDIIEV